MTKYKFPQFNVEIENPIVEIDMNSIRDRALDCLLSVDVILKVENATFGVRLTQMPYVDSWQNEDIEDMVLLKLQEFEVS